MSEKGVTWRWQQFLMFHKACYCWETRSNRLVSTDFLAKIAKNVYRPHFWIKCKGIFEGWITWKLFFLIFSILFFYFFAFSVDGNFSVIYPSVNVIWNVKFFEGVPAVNYTNSVLWIFSGYSKMDQKYNENHCIDGGGSYTVQSWLLFD